MEEKQLVQEYKRLTDAWPGISSFLSLPRTPDDLDRLIGLSDYLMDQTKGDERHPLMGLLDIVGTLISDFERENIPEPEGTPLGCLEYLMREHGLKHEDMTELGPPGVISEIFSGRRELDKDQIKALSKRFGCGPGVFM